MQTGCRTAHTVDFERECERADRLTVELLQATAEIVAAKEMTARLEGEVAALRTGGRAAGSTDTHGHAAHGATGTSCQERTAAIFEFFNTIGGGFN